MSGKQEASDNHRRFRSDGDIELGLARADVRILNADKRREKVAREEELARRRIYKRELRRLKARRDA